MNRFVGSFENRVDKKGRVSVPASYRTVLARQPTQELYLGVDPETGGIDGWSDSYLDEIEARIDQLPIGSPKRDLMELQYFGAPHITQVDGDGRIVLPQRMREQAGLREIGLFVGRGKFFQLWDPERLAAHKARLQASVSDTELPPAPGIRS